MTWKLRYDPFPDEFYLKDNKNKYTIDRDIVYQSICLEIVEPFVALVTMDTKFGRIYCAISAINLLCNQSFFLYLQIQLPHFFTNRNETYGILKNSQNFKMLLLKCFIIF